jgi:hypothetical protein
MTGRTLVRAVRSLYYRQHLAKTIPSIESSIRAELSSRELSSARIGGFHIRISGATLSIEPTASVHPGQLELPELQMHSIPKEPEHRQTPKEVNHGLHQRARAGTT